jgi:hypothetical protein
MTCDGCNGLGWIWMDPIQGHIHCRMCDGSGIAPIIKTSPLNDEQREMVDRYVGLRDWINDSIEFDFRYDRAAGWISENK